MLHNVHTSLIKASLGIILSTNKFPVEQNIFVSNMKSGQADTVFDNFNFILVI